MQFGGTRPGSVTVRKNEYYHHIQFYTWPPLGKLTLEEAEELVTERMCMLQVFDEGKFLENPTSFEQRIKEIDLSLIDIKSNDNSGNFYKNTLKGDQSALRKDHISHFLLRLYYCQNEELRKWFISREVSFFRFRLIKETMGPDSYDKEKALHKLYQSLGFTYDLIEKEKEKQMADKLQFMTFNMKPSHIYKIKFEEALDLVRTRRGYLEKGFVYVVPSEIISVLCKQFRIHLSESLSIMVGDLPRLQEEKRLLPRFHSIHVNEIEKRKSTVKSEDGQAHIIPEMIDDLSKESFPPCMRSIHESLRKEHHLRHYGRLHYGLFLKSVGLSLDDALKFFRDEFTQKVTPERFQRDYAYNIRYNYGKEGKRTNMSPFGCNKIINENTPGPSDTHGCPFKHYDTSNLRLMFNRFGIDEKGTMEMINLVEQKNYMQACTKFFTCKHPWYEIPIIYHPNQYYKESRKAFDPNFIAQVKAKKEQEMKEEAMEVDALLDDDDFDQNVSAYINLDLQTSQEQNVEEKVKEETKELKEEIKESLENDSIDQVTVSKEKISEFELKEVKKEPVEASSND